MTTLFAVRTLKTTGRPDMASQKLSGRSVDGVFMGARRAGAVFEVEANEVSLSREEIFQRLSKGALHSCDLVFAHDRWGTLLEHEEFGALAQARARIEGVRRTARLLLIWLLWSSPFLLGSAYRFWLIGHHPVP